MIDFRKWLVQVGLDEETEIKGVSEYEIDSLERKFSIILPGSYKDFLRQCGASAGLFARDFDFFYHEIWNLKEQFLDAIQDWGVNYQPLKNAFFFSAYQGGSYHYFVCDGDNNPPIFVFYEGDLEPIRVNDSFVEYMRKYISSHQDMFYQNPDKSWLDEKYEM